MLYVVATPIGNLADITYRAIDILKNSHYILCEDTRHSRIVAQQYEITTPLVSYHKFNEASKLSGILKDLSEGFNLALISDAGTPGISDPGTKLIQACIREGIKVVAVPGACAAIAALCCSGLDTDRFQFLGFLPKKLGELRRTLQEVLAYPGTTICYESPNRLIDVLHQIKEISSDRVVVIARELTKKFEEIVRGTPQELLDKWEDGGVRGEIVLMISGKPEKTGDEWLDVSPREHVNLMMRDFGMSQQEAIIAVAKLREVSKRIIYNEIHRENL